MSPRAVGDDEHSRTILNCIRQIVRALRLYDRESQSKFGLSAAQMYVLHTLHQDDGISLNELATRTATDQSSASVVVQRLVAAEMVSRAPREDDRRHVVLRLTPKGRNAIRRTPPPAQEKLLAVANELPPKQRAQFAELLEDFVNRMGINDEPPPMLFADEPPAPRRRGTSKPR
ncbi:MAG TPA: MarR family winged helix-turn-helix transcriptional regulator [Thermoanaerobaculia bacterium]